MRILVVHAWLKGNLGDVLQLSVLLAALRELEPQALDLAGFPAQPAEETGEVLAAVDKYIPEPFIWYWKALPAFVARALMAPRWRAQRAALFSRYDAIVCAPGPYLADYDARSPSALCDITVARELDLPVVLSSHSIGPLSDAALAVVAKASVCIARESSTHAYLHERGIASVPSADFAFLYPYGKTKPAEHAAPSCRLIFLRSNNLRAKSLRLDEGALFEGDRLIAESSSDPLVLATSDYRRDQRFLAATAKKLGVRWVACRTVTELVQLIGASSMVISDRYHPAICAAVLGKRAKVLSNREPHKMSGVRSLLEDYTLQELQQRARSGLSAVREGLQRTA